MIRLLLNGIIGLATLCYPFAVYFGIHYVEPWQIAALLIVVLLLKSLTNRMALPLLIAGMLYGGFAIWHNNLISLRYYPVLVNGVMLSVFAWSLFFPPSVIERLARIEKPNLSAKGIIYTRRVTQVWCGFFVINGSIALITAVWASFELWSLYNGLIAYLLMALLFAGEYLIRIKTQTHD
jgi:uncharacterized membrane protein